MVCLIAALVMQQSLPDTSLRLNVGDSWTQETTYQFTLDDLTYSNLDTTKFKVVKEGGKSVLVAEWKLNHCRIGDEIIKAPLRIEPVVRKVTLDGEDLNVITGSDVTQHRIERAIRIERKGALQEPEFFPVPPYVRLVGIKQVVELEPRKLPEKMFAVSVQEMGGDKPMKGIGYYQLDPVSGILKSGHWTIVNCPVPGGDDLVEMQITVEAKNLKLAPRKS
ncbi:MAG TPA: hypothetical protein VJ835_03945 [Fimbriimonadaceae bacterium]|nr:hypothetical protein [Fimbriimonadaceae bacterium]